MAIEIDYYKKLSKLVYFKDGKPYKIATNKEYGKYIKDKNAWIIRTKINGVRKDIRAHRLHWYMIHGELSKFNLSHIDGDKKNNRIENLSLFDHNSDEHLIKAKRLNYWLVKYFENPFLIKDSELTDELLEHEGFWIGWLRKHKLDNYNPIRIRDYFFTHYEYNCETKTLSKRS